MLLYLEPAIYDGKTYKIAAWFTDNQDQSTPQYEIWFQACSMTAGMYKIENEYEPNHIDGWLNSMGVQSIE